MDRNLRRLKNTPFPKLPTNADEIKSAFKKPEILEQYGFNLRGSERFYVDTITDTQSAFTVFASTEAIRLTVEHIPPNERRYLLDATFDVTPIGGFYQLLIVYIEFKNDVFPIAYIAMKDKKTETYESVFRFLNSKVFELEPMAFMTDHEAGLIKALKNCFPGTPTYRCWYHFKAAVRRNAVRLGLQKLIKGNEIAKSTYKKMLNLPLLPPEDIPKAFEAIKKGAKKQKLGKQFTEFFKYFENYWMKVVSFLVPFRHINASLD